MRLILCIQLLVFSVSLHAKVIDVAVGWTKPPYVIKEGDTGFELDLVREIFASIGHDIRPVYVPYGRTVQVLKSGAVDVALTLTSRLDIEEKYLSDTYIIYQNAAISLKRKALPIRDLTDLENYSVVAFQKAQFALGRVFREVTSKSRLYIELPEQRRQVEMLLQEKTDVVVMDVNIFTHLSEQISGEDQTGNIQVHSFFPATHYRAGFTSQEMKQQFNRALKTFKNSDAYLALMERYGVHALLRPQSALTKRKESLN